MLNWIAIWVGIWLFGDGGPLQNSANSSVPISNDVAASAQLPVFWGVQGLQGLDIGFFVALAALVVFGLLLNRTTLGYEVRAVGFNPEAAALRRDQRAEEPHPRDGDLRRVRRPRRRARHARLPLPLRDVRHPRELGRLPRDRRRAARTQHRGRRRLRRAPLRRAPVRDDARPVVERHRPVARRQPHLHHPGARRPVRRRRRADPLRLGRPETVPSAGEHRRVPELRRELGLAGPEEPAQPVVPESRDQRVHRDGARRLRGVHRDPADPDANTDLARRHRHLRRDVRHRHRQPGQAAAGLRRRRRRAPRDRARPARHAVERREPQRRLQRLAARADVRLRDAARLRRDRRDVLRAKRRREHRPRGDDADGRVLGRLGRRQGRQLDRGHARRHGSWWRAGARLRVLRDPPPRRPDRRRHRRELPRARHHRVLLLPALPRELRLAGRLDDPERSSCRGSPACTSSARRSATSA